MPHTALTLNQAAKLLNLAPEELERLAVERAIPCERQGGRLVFRQGAVEAWARVRILGLDGKRLAAYHRGSARRSREAGDAVALIPELTQPAFIHTSLPSRTAASVLRAMVDLADATGKVDHPRDLLEALRQREAAGSTALEGGAAILHPAHHDPYLFDGSFLAVGRTVQPLPFGAPDGRCTRLFFLLCCDASRLHLHAMARLCLLFAERNLLEDLLEAPGAEPFYEVLVSGEREVLRRLGG